jgi:hypothetical protein
MSTAAVDVRENDMATTSPRVPDMAETDLDRADLEEAARELGLEVSDDIDDQALLERIGVELGAVPEDAVEEAADETEDQAERATDEATDEAQDTADDATDDAEDQADQATDEAQEAAGDAQDQAEDTAGDAQDEADDTAGDATDEAEQTTDEAADTADDADRSPVREAGEYRFEDDPREGVEPILDLELGPVALDVLGVEVHLRRVHAVLTANPGSRRNVIGKILAQLSRAAHASNGGDDETDTADQDQDAGGDDDQSGGLLSKLTSPVRSIASRVKETVTPGG